MKFEFTTTTQVDTTAWSMSNRKLEQDLHELATTTLSEVEVETYLTDMTKELKPVNNDSCNGMLFLMYDAPSSMPADARVEYVYKPTYIAATILMTAMIRFEKIAANDTFRKTTHDVLEAAMGRNFLGAGYDEYVGLMETLKTFAQGETLSFIEKFRAINEDFACKFEETLAFLETDICSGKIKDAWSGEDYSVQGNEVLAMYQAKNESNYVWYACYGSNVNKNRFMAYIRNCSDSTPPVDDRPFVFEHSIYFAKSASCWQNGGKAFLDDTVSGSAYGRIYKITREQYEEVKRHEGTDYTKKICLGEIDGHPVYSFTDTQKNSPSKTPSGEYFTTIAEGLKECYHGILSEKEIMDYLTGAILSEDAYLVARTIKENTHYITNAEISSITGLDLMKVTNATTWLLANGMIQQDQRSSRAGHCITDPEAFFFTSDKPTARGLLKAMIELYPEEIQEEETEAVNGDVEGNRNYVFASRIERSSRNRIEAIKLHGYKCQVCGFDFAERYGELGKNYIEVHHVNPLAAQGGQHIVNPETELVCLCANCHRMIHRNREAVLSVDELRAIVNN